MGQVGRSVVDVGVLSGDTEEVVRSLGGFGEVGRSMEEVGVLAAGTGEKGRSFSRRHRRER